MNKFLFEKFPLAYARIYKAVIQNKGKEIIPKAIKCILERKDLDSLLDREDSRLSQDVYVGINDMKYVAKHGYSQILNMIKNDRYSDRITNPIEGIVLQISQSDRWRKKFNETDEQFDLILAIPRWSRIVSLSTSEIQPRDLLEKINQFDRLLLKNYHFYEIFNKLHGVVNRTAHMIPQTSMQKAHNCGELNFILRTIKDVKILSNSTNLKLFTIVSDINGILRCGFYFSIIGKIKTVNQAFKLDRTGLDPFSYELEVVDDTDMLKIRLNAGNFTRVVRESYLFDELNKFFGSKKSMQNKFVHPSELENHVGYFLMVCNWFLGDDMPNITYMIPLNDDISYEEYPLVEFMNTRKKYLIKEMDARWKDKLDSIIKTNENLEQDASHTWLYYKESTWNKDIFAVMIERKFGNMQFHDRIKTGIPIQKFKKWSEYTKKYFKINEYIKNLYITNEPNKEFLSAYSQLNVNEIEDEQDEEIKQMPNLIPIKSWSNIKKYIPRLKEDFSVEEIFSWRNGGKILHRKNIDYQYKHSVKVDPIYAAVEYIWQARGCIWLPEKMTKNDV